MEQLLKNLLTPETLALLSQYSLVIIPVLVLLLLIRAQAKRPARRDLETGELVLRWSGLLVWTSGGCAIAMPLLMAVVSFLIPLPGAQVFAPIAIGGVPLLAGGVMCLYFIRRCTRLGAQGITSEYLFARRRFLPWNDVVGVRFKNGQEFWLHGPGRQKALLHVWFVGVKEAVPWLRQYLPDAVRQDANNILLVEKFATATGAPPAGSWARTVTPEAPFPEPATSQSGGRADVARSELPATGNFAGADGSEALGPMPLPDDIASAPAGAPIVECRYQNGAWLLGAGFAFLYCLIMGVLTLVFVLRPDPARPWQDLWFFPLSIPLVALVGAGMVYHYFYYRRKRLQLWHDGLRWIRPPGFYRSGRDRVEHFPWRDIDSVSLSCFLGSPRTPRYKLVLALTLKSKRSLAFDAEQYNRWGMYQIAVHALRVLRRGAALAALKELEAGQLLTFPPFLLDGEGFRWKGGSMGGEGAMAWEQCGGWAVDGGGFIRVKIEDIYGQTGVHMTECGDFGKMAALAELLTARPVETVFIAPDQQQPDKSQPRKSSERQSQEEVKIAPLRSSGRAGGEDAPRPATGAGGGEYRGAGAPAPRPARAADEREVCYLCGAKLQADELAARVCRACRL
jgi:hypothetical protein